MIINGSYYRERKDWAKRKEGSGVSKVQYIGMTEVYVDMNQV